MADELTPVIKLGQSVQYCPMLECRLPFEYCKFGPCPGKCNAWIATNLPDIHAELNGQDSDAKGVGKKQKSKDRGKASKKAGKTASEKEVKIYQFQRSKRKFITAIIGLDSFGLDLKQSAKKMAKQFACSASVVKCTPPPNEIHIQGDVKFELADFMLNKLKIPKELLFFLEGKKKKKIPAFSD
eukprot:CAMPEP_0185255466 /NCGR_PEP_ID=MMETSP1359-20130426/4506_1 /TAXON_ID=552665 /ORGANISM="Bigelowiella longifila, Strain CCMP242" /LENGTH=183 /DNA_ID=CAMNT_0027839389 /DNA_START=8 /DNA_END=559 /DNA_ORIENTATION=-